MNSLNSKTISSLLNITENEWFRLLRESNGSEEKMISLLNISINEWYRLFRESNRLDKIKL
jgi:hypothetical protein